MTLKDRRKQNRDARRAALRSVAAAPSFQAVKTRRTRRSPLRRALLVGASLMLPVAMMFATPKTAMATPPPPVPEIDPSSMAGAMTLLVGGFLALTDRNRQS